MPAKKHLFIKLASSISAFLVVAYFGISAYAGRTLSKQNICFDPLKASVFAVPPENVTFRAPDDVEIAGWFIPEKATDKVLILVHKLNRCRTCELAGKLAEFG